MRKNFLRTSLHLACMGLVLSSAMTQAVVNWSGGPQAVSVIDDNLIITNDNSIVGGVQIIANTVDITVSVPANINPAIVRGTAGGPSRLFLQPSVGRTITFDLTQSLSFFGSSAGPELLVYVSGGGDVEFILSDNQTLTIGADTTGAGTRFYLKMETNDASTVTFQRANQASSDNAYVVVGRDSLISYVATTAVSTGAATETGVIGFDPANTGFGRLELIVENNGAVIVTGNLQSPFAAPPFLLLSDIDMTVPAGLSAQFVVANTVGSSAQAGLLVLNENLIYPSLLIDPFSTNLPFDGERFGFVLGANGGIAVGDNAYLDYVGASTNYCLNAVIDPVVLDGRDANAITKPRNPSALIVDGNDDPNALPAIISLGNSSAIYFRSGVDDVGVIENYEGYDFAVSPTAKTCGAGNFVFDVEGNLLINGESATNNAIEILSLFVVPTGGSVRSDTNETNFPLRTFAKDTNGDYIMYNCGAFFINADVVLNNVTLVHTDSCHQVYENNDVLSEPAYVGGDSFVINQSTARPTINFINSQLYVQTSIAFTGVDLAIPSVDLLPGNISDFQFFQNGKVYDDCSGRNMILGTLIGSAACDGCSIISRDAHLDIIPSVTTGGLAQTLLLTTTTNNSKVIENLPNNIENQFSIQTIYLGWASNISIGNNSSTNFGNTPTLDIAGNYFSFATRGGLHCSPETSNVTGQGGIFVDMNGLFTIDSTRRATIATMVTRSRNGIIDLPKNQVFFNLRVGIANWNLDLNDPAQREIVAHDQLISDYTLNWIGTTKDYTNYMPYDIGEYSNCFCPPVTRMNVSAIPVVSGIVDQFQIEGSRFGCPATIMIDCGWVRELPMFKGLNSGEIPTAVVVLQNQGRLGLGTAQTNFDSTSAELKLGINGITIIANGTGQVDLNQDIVIDNICAILKGPDFSLTGTNVLTISSQVPHTLRVRPTGILDLTSFDNVTDTVIFDTNVKVVFEPGSQLKMGSLTLRFFDNSQFIVEPYFGCVPLAGTSVRATDDRRVRVSGTGVISLEDDAIMQVWTTSYLGIETDNACTSTFTNITLTLEDNAQVQVGDEFLTKGGIFQVGNTTNQEVASVNFTLNINGENAKFIIGSQGMFGLGVGIVNDISELQNEWLVDGLFNVGTITINIENGDFVHNHIFAGNNVNAALFALGQAQAYNLFFNEVTGEILGGGNLISITPTITGTGMNPTVLMTDGVITPSLSVGILSSTPLLRDVSGEIKEDLVNPATQNELFTYLKVVDTGLNSNIRVVSAETGTNFAGILIGYVASNDATDNVGIIFRRTVEAVVGPNGLPASEDSRATSIGAARAIFPGDNPQEFGQAPVVFELSQVGSSQRGLNA